MINIFYILVCDHWLAPLMKNELHSKMNCIQTTSHIPPYFCKKWIEYLCRLESWDCKTYYLPPSSPDSLKIPKNKKRVNLTSSHTSNKMRHTIKNLWTNRQNCTNFEKSWKKVWFVCNFPKATEVDFFSKNIQSWFYNQINISWKF